LALRANGSNQLLPGEMTKKPEIRKVDRELCDAGLLRRWLYGVPSNAGDDEQGELTIS